MDLILAGVALLAHVALLELDHNAGGYCLEIAARGPRQPSPARRSSGCFALARREAVTTTIRTETRS